ncbi:MAG: inorganic diphosphatase [Minisyncoccia bacterium]|jgi:inorganic pyrophosphatase
MDINNIPLGTPEEFNVLVEISTGSSNKYEYDEALQAIKLDYVFHDGFHFPFNYGLIPHTRAEDNDPLDAIVLSSYPIQPNTVVMVKPLGILRLKDRGEQDNKLVTVPSVDPLADKLKSINDLSDKEKEDIAAFFKEVGVQKNKTMDIEGFFGRDEAVAEVKRYKS